MFPSSSEKTYSSPVFDATAGTAMTECMEWVCGIKTTAEQVTRGKLLE